MTLKETLISKCYKFASERKSHIDFQIKEIKEALFEEIKSSVGDKHETGRAMLQLEREKVGNQFYEVENMFETLNKINFLSPSLVVHLGSVVYTTQANYFIAISTGKLETEGQTFYAISSNTPIGKLLMAQSEGAEIKFRDQSFRIKKID